ncbi:methyltransferase domain-containing protein [Streptomyces sp. 3MP-14]|uniref:Methyltransferase domain-containing protein n=1 Tax=Streptomyces mimosae TaxID=2586635 RepID=A0A5N6ACN0_9ACTN|nr:MULTISPECIES: class I SAM-dependent methyltransferase [Streptomyces]KAB8165268.1 methyltransferase domain-containing protein [Streptomyces mimosae]KAB8175900.1 methyltransferase domain-containing protein [Streptomyces sp. 3MP-14]
MTELSAHLPAHLPAHLRATADAYDGVAARYAELFRDALDGQPLERAVLAAFADLVRAAGGGGGEGGEGGEGGGERPGPVAELGCGPGAVTAHLRDLGLDAFGVDLSPAMIDLAREAYPDLRFEVGSMDELDALGVADGGLRGVVSWYSLIHTPPAEVPRFLAEFRRVLVPGGLLLLGFFGSEDESVTPFDHKVTTAYGWPLDALAERAGAAGFTEIGRLRREPVGEERRLPLGYLLLRGR